MSAPLVAPVGGGDAARLAAVHASAFARGWTPEAIGALLEDQSVIALHAELGFVMLRCVADEGEVLTLAVAPAARRQGLARALLAQAIAAARERGAATIWLEVAGDNAPALALYDSLGFVACGRRKGYYQRVAGVVDAVVMQRRCGPAGPGGQDRG